MDTRKSTIMGIKDDIMVTPEYSKEEMERKLELSMKVKEKLSKIKKQTKVELKIEQQTESKDESLQPEGAYADLSKLTEEELIHGTEDTDDPTPLYRHIVSDDTAEFLKKT